MKDQVKELLMREFLGDVEALVTEPSKLLLVLNTIAKQEDELDIAELALLSEVGPSALNLRCSFAEEGKPSSPRAVVDVDEIGANLIQQKIVELQENGVQPGDLPEVTPQNMDSFLSKMSNYLLESAALPTVAEIFEARKDSKNARFVAKIPNVIIDNIFRAVAVGGNLTSLPMEMYNRVSQGIESNVIADVVSKISGEDRGNLSVPAYLFIAGISKGGDLGRAIMSSGAAYLGKEQGGLSAQDAEILGCLVLGAVKQGSLTGGINSATQELINQESYKYLGGPKDLKDINFSKAKESFWLSREMADTAVTCLTRASEVLAGVVGKGVSSAIGGATGEAVGILTEEAVKVTASIALLGTLVVLKNYLAQDTVGKAQNPELLDSTIKDISVAVDQVSSGLQEVAQSIERPSEEKQWGITEADLDPGVREKALRAARPAARLVVEAERLPSAQVKKRIDSVEISTGSRAK